MYDNYILKHKGETMLLSLCNRKARVSLRLVIVFLAVMFLFVNVAYFVKQSESQSVLSYMPKPTELISITSAASMPVLKGIKLYPEDPFKFDFILDVGKIAMSDKELKQESSKLLKYFLAALTIPDQDLWVNLSPFEKDRIIPQYLGLTDMGKDMLGEDYVLKQLTSSLTYPESKIGNEFWKSINEKVNQQTGSRLPINTFNKIWIVPKTAVIYEDRNRAVISESKLKVMVEDDYIALKHNKIQSAENVSSDAMKEIIIPVIEGEVNNGEHFATLRQIYNSLILGVWFKQTMKSNILNLAYSDKNKISGVEVDDLKIKEKIYKQYVEAYQQKVYDYIKREYDQTENKIVNRAYYSGGLGLSNVRNILQRNNGIQSSGVLSNQDYIVTVRMDPVEANLKITSSAVSAPDKDILLEVGRLLDRLKDRGLTPKINKRSLFIFEDDPQALMSFLQRYSVIKDLNDIRRILQWKLNTMSSIDDQGNLSGYVLSGEKNDIANLLYDSVFNQEELLADQKINIVLFRRGRYGGLMTKILKSLPNVNVKIILSATDDGLSWRNLGAEHGFTGVPAKPTIRERNNVSFPLPIVASTTASPASTL